ncbi:peptidase S8/S53 domain-containing protein [Thelonectria olida]|uniref:Peptidase S8/S53 domain-containing protein n=1 Tax=Thelonectria olida TaxID=1576542 RepID=A0A9P8VSN8_9HYPO|nr:peptidase S8/S53 domain-containing protein [Thelonectria olida]
MTYDKEPSCETESASLCSTTTYLSQTVVGPVTSTIASTASDCETIYGCSLTDWESETTVTSEECALPTRDSRRDVDENPDSANLAASDCAAPAIVYPRDSHNVGQVPVLLDKYKGKYVEIGAPEFNYTAFYWIPMLDKDTLATLLKSPDVDDAYYYEEWNAKVGGKDVYESFLDNSFSATGYKRNNVPTQDDGLESANDTLTDRDSAPRPQLEKRAQKTRATKFWPGSQVSLPYRKKWKAADSGSYDASNQNAPYKFHWDNDPTQEQFVYVVAEAGLWKDHEFKNRQGNIEYLAPSVAFGPEEGAVDSPDLDHGSRVCAMIVGEKLGECERCKLVLVTTRPPAKKWFDSEQYPREKALQNLIDALRHIKRNGREGRASINMSFSYLAQVMRPAFLAKLQEVLTLLQDEAQAALVVAAGNHAAKNEDGPLISRYPALFADPGRIRGHLPTMIVVGATDDETEQASFSQYADFLTTYAPGEDVPVPAWSLNMDGYTTGGGTSYVAALAAYFRGLPSPWQYQLRKPANVKKMIKLFHRRFAIEGVSLAPELRRPVIWNGQVGSKSCLTDYLTKDDWDKHKACPDINLDLDKVPENPGEPVYPCKSGGSAKKRQDGSGGSCPILPGDDSALSKKIDWDQGSDSPKCAAQGGCGGRLCTGYYCTSNPKGPPPDFRDPKDPNKGGDKPSTTKAPDSTTTTTEKPPETTKEEDPPDNYCINMYVRSKTTTGGGPLRLMGTGGSTAWDIWLEYNGKKVCEDKPECLDCREQEVKCNDGFSMKVIVSDDPGEYTDVVISFPGTKNKTVRLENTYNRDECNFSKSYWPIYFVASNILSQGTNPYRCPEYKYKGSDGGCR